MNLKNRHFLTLLDYTSAEIEGLLDLAADLKAKKKAGIAHRLCEGKNVALIFEKTSTRTRCAFEVAAADLGADAQQGAGLVLRDQVELRPRRISARSRNAGADGPRFPAPSSGGLPTCLSAVTTSTAAAIRM